MQGHAHIQPRSGRGLGQQGRGVRGDVLPAGRVAEQPEHHNADCRRGRFPEQRDVRHGAGDDPHGADLRAGGGAQLHVHSGADGRPLGADPSLSVRHEPRNERQRRGLGGPGRHDYRPRHGVHHMGQRHGDGQRGPLQPPARRHRRRPDRRRGLPRGAAPPRPPLRRRLRGLRRGRVRHLRGVRRGRLRAARHPDVRRPVTARRDAVRGTGGRRAQPLRCRALAVLASRRIPGDVPGLNSAVFRASPANRAQPPAACPHAVALCQPHEP
mmetsp:Transcript_10047/g.16998  ORF Transcript_10047/g.16998 Transcript_10047/m.16998 type:complete len:269 (-) Transcript_10047:1745-2551(-)